MRVSPTGSNRSRFRSGWWPRQEAGPKDAGLTSSHARVGYRIIGVSSRGCLALGASVGAAHNRPRGFPTWSCLRPWAPAMDRGVLILPTLVVTWGGD